MLGNAGHGLRPLLWVKGRVLRHLVRNFFSGGIVAPISVAVIGTLFTVGGAALFLAALQFLASFPTVGSLLVDRILILFFVTLMVMLTFSAMLISFSTLYKAEEMKLLWTLPIGPVALFRARTGESIFLAAWAFIVLGGPMLICWGVVQGAKAEFYVVLPLLLIPFTLVCGLAGALLTLGLAYIFPRLSWRTLCVLVGLAALAAGGYVLAAFEVWRVRGSSSLVLLNQILVGLHNLQSPLAPSYWAFAGLGAAARGNLASAAKFGALLWINVLMLEVVLARFVPRLFFPGYSALSKASGRPGRKFGQGILAWLGRRLWFLQPAEAALSLRDFRLFWRDPAQWSQFLLFAMLMAVYVGNIQHLPRGVNSPVWINILHYLNLLSCALLLATLTSRFIYPLVSLEGKTFWVVGLAPISRSRLLRQKLWLSLSTTLVFSEIMVAASCYRMAIPMTRIAEFCLVILLMNLTLSSVAVGFAAIYPNFEEDNPSKIVNGAGGIINFFASLTYTVISVLVLAAPHHFLQSEQITPDATGWWINASWVAFIAMSLAFGTIPLLLGMTRFRRFEF